MATARPSDPITMGGYTDLPPEQRPGYTPQPSSSSQPHQQHHHHHQQQQPHQQQPQYPYGTVQYAQHAATYNYNPAATSPTSQTGPTRNPSSASGFQYAAPPDKITFSAKPVISKTAQQQQQQQQQQQPSVRHTPVATAPQPQYYGQQPSPHNEQQQHQQPPPPPPQQQQQQQSYFTAIPHAPAPPPPPPPQAPQQPPPQHAYPPPLMGRHSPHHDRPHLHQRASSQSNMPQYDGRNVVEVVPQGSGGRINAPPSPGLRPHSLSVGGGRPDGLTNRMDRLSVSGNRPDMQTIMPGGYPGGGGGGGGGMPPPSPLLEAYHGTYQSISPMPQAMMLDDDLDHLPMLDHLSPRGSNTSVQGGHRRTHSSSRRSPSPRRSKNMDKLALAAYGGGGGSDYSRDRDRDHNREKEKRVKLYDAYEDSMALVEAMSARPINADVLIDILPALNHDNMLELRSEYKRHCKVQGRGINVAKHIKLKTTGNFGKIAYVTALGKYESEGYWANYWYQSGNARRELLIEALMGRTNFDIREIKDSFKDKRYSDSLVRCMDKELKADKFRKAVLMALEGERQEESEVWDPEYRNRDVDTLYKAIAAREGGESAILNIVILRSDAHLREVLRTYERKYRSNFARDALQKSNNLVGEVVAHILNGVINRPARDAMLLHHALMDLIEPSHEKSGKSSTSAKHERQQRYELLISRLVRLHWDRFHLLRVTREYEDKYGRVVEEDIEEATKGDFREFCLALCHVGR